MCTSIPYVVAVFYASSSIVTNLVVTFDNFIEVKLIGGIRYITCFPLLSYATSVIFIVFNGANCIVETV